MTGLYTCYNPYCNPLFTSENKLARAPTENSGTFAPILISIISCTPTSTLAPAPALLRGIYTNVDL